MELYLSELHKHVIVDNSIDPLLETLAAVIAAPNPRLSSELASESEPVDKHLLQNRHRNIHRSLLLQWLSSDLTKRRTDIHEQIPADCGVAASDDIIRACHNSITPAERLLLNADVNLLCTLRKVDRWLPRKGDPACEWRFAVIVSSAERMLGMPHLTLGDISPDIGLSPRYLGKLFHQYTKVSFRKYFRALRIAKAADWLCTSLGPIKQAADLSGYPSPNNFIRDFIEETALTPTEYRNTRKCIRATVSSM